MGDTTTVPDSAGEFADAAASFAGLDEVLWDTISTATLLRSHPRFDERVLDAYSRDGASALPTAELVGVGGLVDAVEPAEPLVELARERAGERMPQLNLHVAEPGDWEPTGYDLVQCVLGIASFADVEAGTRRLIDRARPGGRVAIAVWARAALDPLPDLLAAALPGAASETGGAEADADVDDGAGAEAIAEAEADADEAAPAHTVEVADTAGSLAHWLTELGLVDVRAEAVQRHVDLTPELAWLLVQGTGLRALVADLGDDELDEVRERYLGAIAERGVTAVDATTLIAVGRRPE
jgi:SAM-dependent methyltransferase